MTKTCAKCGMDKPENAFAKNTHTPDGLFRWCRDCWNASRRAKYANDPKPFLSSQKKWVAKKKGVNLGSCAWCGEIATKLVKITFGGETSLPSCNCCNHDLSSLGRMDEAGVNRILSRLTPNEIEDIGMELVVDAMNVRASHEAFVRFKKRLKRG